MHEFMKIYREKKHKCMNALMHRKMVSMSTAGLFHFIELGEGRG